MFNPEFGKIKKTKVKRKNSDDSSGSNTFIGNNNKKINNDKTLIVNKIEWTDDLKYKVNASFNDPDLYLKDVPGVIINKMVHGPRYSDNNQKDLIPYSIVGSSKNFSKIMSSKDKRNDSKSRGTVNQKRKKSNSSIMSLATTNKPFNIHDNQNLTKGLKASTSMIKQSQLIDPNNPNATCRYVEDDQVFKQFKKIKERIIQNETDSLTNSNPLSILKEKLNYSSDSSMDELNDTKSKLYNGTQNTQHRNKTKYNSRTSFKESNTLMSNSIGNATNNMFKSKNTTTNDMMSESQANKPQNKKINKNSYDYEMIKDLRIKLKKDYYSFLSKIYNGRMDASTLNSKSLNVPFDILSEINKQNLVLNKYKETKLNREKIEHNIAKITNKTIDKLLVNKNEEHRWKTSILNNNEMNKTLPDKIGGYQWMATLRKPDDFKGVRLSYFNTGTDYWYPIRELQPIDPEIVLPNFNITNKYLDEKSSILSPKADQIINFKPNQDANNYRRGAKQTKFDLKIDENTAYKLIATKIKSVIKLGADGNERFTMLGIENQYVKDFIQHDKKRLKILEKLAPISENRIEGSNLLDFEIINFRSLKGRKIMYNSNINPLTQKEYTPDEKKEEFYACNYSSKPDIQLVNRSINSSIILPNTVNNSLAYNKSVKDISKLTNSNSMISLISQNNISNTFHNNTKEKKRVQSVVWN